MESTAVYDLSIPGAIAANGRGSNAYAGAHGPDIIGNIRVDRASGLFQISAAAHELSGSYNVLGRRPLQPDCLGGHPKSNWGG